MRSKRVRIAAALLMSFALVASACSSDDDDNGASVEAGGENGGGAEGQLVMGTLVPQTGDLNVIVDSLATPIQMAIDEINEAGGVFGQDVKLVAGDDGTNPTVAETTYSTHINSNGVHIILGPAPSSVAAKLADKFGTDSIPACSGSTTAAELTGAGNGYFFRTAPPDSLQGPALAELIASDGHANVAIIARNDDYGTGFAGHLETALTDGGNTVTETVFYNVDSASGYEADVQRALATSPDALAVIGFNDDGAAILSALIGQNAGPDVMPTYTADGMQSSSFGETVDPANPGVVAGIKGTAPAASPSGIEHPFHEAFAETGVDTIFSSYFYDCTILMALAAISADSTEGTAIKDAFAGNLQGDNDCATFAECKELLEDGETIHFRGASSNYDKWLDTEPGSGVYDVWQYDADGAVESLDVDQIRID